MEALRHAVAKMVCKTKQLSYRALLNSAVSGTDHRIHTTKEKAIVDSCVLMTGFKVAGCERYGDYGDLVTCEVSTVATLGYRLRKAASHHETQSCRIARSLP